MNNVKDKQINIGIYSVLVMLYLYNRKLKSHVTIADVAPYLTCIIYEGENNISNRYCGIFGEIFMAFDTTCNS